MARTVVTYTTLPDRYDLLYQSLLSIHKQTHRVDRIYLTVPAHVSRLNKEYPPLPDKIQELCQVLHIDTDYGPVTKLYGALMMEEDPDTIIISCDDDVIYPPTLVEVLVTHHTRCPNTAICGTGALLGHGVYFLSLISSLTVQVSFTNWISGFAIPPTGRNVDLVFGVGGVLYLRKFFPPPSTLYDNFLMYTAMDVSIFHNDDILISGYLAYHNIPRKIFSDIPPVHHAPRHADALSYNLFKMITRMNTSFIKAQSYGLFPQLEPVSWSESFIVRVILLVVGILLIIIVIVYYKNYKRITPIF